jgi:hypothetical protein
VKDSRAISADRQVLLHEVARLAGELRERRLGLTRPVRPISVRYVGGAVEQHSLAPTAVPDWETRTDRTLAD